MKNTSVGFKIFFVLDDVWKGYAMQEVNKITDKIHGNIDPFHDPGLFCYTMFVILAYLKIDPLKDPDWLEHNKVEIIRFIESSEFDKLFEGDHMISYDMIHYRGVLWVALPLLTKEDKEVWVSCTAPTYPPTDWRQHEARYETPWDCTLQAAFERFKDYQARTGGKIPEF